MSEIRDALGALRTHASHIESLVEGGTVLQDAIPRSVTTALRGASALRPAGEDSWRLHPRLREYLQDHLQLVTPFQSLKEIGQAIASLAWLRDEMDAAARERDQVAFDSLEASTRNTVYDIADATESNVAFLTGMVSLRYGTAKTLAAKLSENRWYERQARALETDLGRLVVRAEDLARHAEAKHWDIGTVIRRVILTRMAGWTGELSEVLTRLRAEVFLLRQVEANLRNLARADAFMAQQPSWRGPEADLPEQIPDVLLATALAHRLRAHVDPQDDFAEVRKDVELIVQSLPPRKVAREPEPPKRMAVVREEQGEPVLDAYAEALHRLKLQVLDAATPISLVQWHAQDAAAAALRPPASTGLRPASWLMLAICALEDRPHRLRGAEIRFQVDLLMNPPQPGRRLATTFRDAMVQVAKQ
ncbi:hypothetical protein [Ramlibacter sp. AN1133]|uniref:hypothetical protein n=1 Tax=Ramlibacter sp. AN1133 TaxID=3133429 RepID=UPI0030BBE546